MAERKVQPLHPRRKSRGQQQAQQLELSSPLTQPRLQGFPPSDLARTSRRARWTLEPNTRTRRIRRHVIQGSQGIFLVPRLHLTIGSPPLKKTLQTPSPIWTTSSRRR